MKAIDVSLGAHYIGDEWIAHDVLWDASLAKAGGEPITMHHPDGDVLEVIWQRAIETCAELRGFARVVGKHIHVKVARYDRRGAPRARWRRRMERT